MSDNNRGSKADGFIEYLSPKKMQELRDQVPQAKGDFNPTITPLFKSRSGKSYLSLTIGPEQFDALQKIELGSKLVIKIRRPCLRRPAASSNRGNYSGRPAAAKKPRDAADDL